MKLRLNHVLSSVGCSFLVLLPSSCGQMCCACGHCLTGFMQMLLGPGSGALC